MSTRGSSVQMNRAHHPEQGRRRRSSASISAGVQSLVVRTGPGLGDTVLSEPALQAIRAVIPDAALHVMLPPVGRPLSVMGFPGDHFPRYASRRSCLNRYAAFD